MDKYNIWQPLALSIMMAIGMILGIKINDNEDFGFIEKIESTEGQIAAPGRVEEILRFIESRYVDEMNADPLIEAAVASIIGKLDPHSVYINPEQIKAINEQMEGSFMGIGIETFFIEDTVNVVSVAKGGPAENAGILAFDKIISINDSIVAGKGLEFASIRKMLQGKESDTVRVGLVKRGEKDIVFKNVAVSEIPIPSVSAFYSMSDSIAYVKIKRFSSNTYKEFMEALEKMVEEKGCKHLVMDLRDNPGGYLPETTDILNQLFDDKGNLLVYTEGRNRKKAEYRSKGKRFFNIEKVAVLINENSASGSEIIAGAVQDWDRGVLIGRRSFGKGLVQEQYPLKNGGAIRLTVARYYTPSGRSIQRPYEDKQLYAEDLEERYQKGELFDQDSISHSDSLSFYTQILNRKVFGGGGIDPDIFIPLDSTLAEYDYVELSSYIPGFAFDVLSSSPDMLTKNEEDFMANFEAGKEMIAGFKNYVFPEENNVEDFFPESYTNELAREIKANIAKYCFGEKAMYKVYNQDDAFISEAISYIRSEKKLSEL